MLQLACSDCLFFDLLSHLQDFCTSPEKAWAAATAVAPSWSELQQVEFPEVSWTEIWNTTKDGTSDIWDNTAEGASDIGAKVKKWMSAKQLQKKSVVIPPSDHSQ